MEINQKIYIKTPTFGWHGGMFGATLALWFANDCGFSSIVLEGDYEIVHKALNCVEVSLSSFGHLVDEVKTLARSFVQSFSLVFVDKTTL